MGKNKTIVIGAVLVATLLAGCGDHNAALEQHAEAEAASSPETTEVPAFHFESGTLELGDFDPQTLGDDLFDPCTEISEEEFAAAGITGVVPLEPIETVGDLVSQSCKTDEYEPGIARTVSATKTNYWVTLEVHGNQVDLRESAVPKLFTHQNVEVDPNTCYAQVDTRRGGIAIAVSARGMKAKVTDPCALAVEQLEHLFEF